MAQILDELIIKLGLDSSGFKRDASSTQAAVAQTGSVARREGRALEEVLGKTQAETQKRMRQVEEVGRGAAQGFNKLKNEVVGLLGAIAGAYGLAQFTRNVVTANAALRYNAESIGLAVSELAAWDEAGKRVGGTAGDVTEALKGISAETQNFLLTSQSSAIPVLRLLNSMPGAMLAFKDAAGQATKPVEFLLALSDRLSKMSLPEALSIGRQIPGMNDTTIRLAHEGRGAIEKRLAEARRLGVPGEPDTKAAVALQKAWDDLQQTAINLGTIILTNLTPRITDALKAMTEWVIESKKWLPKDVEDSLNGLIEWLKKVGSGIKEVVDFMGGWKVATEVLFGLWVATKIAPIATLILSLATAMGSLATATLALDTAAGGSGIKTLLGVGAAAGLAYGVNALLEKLEEQIYGKEFMDKDKAFRDSHSPIRDFVGRMVSGGGVSQGGATDERKAQVRDYLSEKLNISGAAASGIVTNLNAESGIRGINEANNGPGFGMPQWTDTSGSPRRTNFFAWAKAHNMDPASDAANLGYLEEELKTKYPQVLAQLRRGDITATEAGNIVARQYIVPPSDKIAGHVAGAEGIAKLPTTNRTVNRPDLTTGMPVGPQSAIDPGMRFALRPDASSVDNSRSNTSSSETNIGAITVHTAATDTDGIAKGIGASLKKYAFVPVANYGLAAIPVLYLTHGWIL